MREIKFRAWDKYKKSMIYQEDGKEGIEFNFGGSSPAVVVWDYKPRLVNGECVDDYQAYHPEDFELMQYTGLKDKNGKEIYEGDIIRETCQDYPTGSFEQTWQVEDLMEFYHRLDPEVGFYPHNLEIIGNIYENQELIK